MPPELEYLWTWFCALSRSRQVGMALSAFSNAEVLAWQARHGKHFEPYEHEIVDRIDDLYIAQHNKKAK